MKDPFKRETVVDFSVWSVNSKYIRHKSRNRDAKMCKRKARRKNKILLKTLDNQDLI